jgi:N-acyl-phosphatidylethanolamine-hydrolysing phospholipase D
VTQSDFAPLNRDGCCVAAVARKAHHGVGRFVNPWPSFVEHGLSAAPKMLRDYDRSRCGPVEMPVVAVDFAATAAGALAAGPGAMAVTWLGHATTLVQFSGGGAVLTDPILSERCSPISFVGPKRFTAAPVAAGALPRLDAIVLSHNHYDHTCTRTVGAIAAGACLARVRALRALACDCLS